MDTEYRYQRLYRNLYNPSFYLLAYQNIYNNGGSMTKGIDGLTLSGMGMERINRIINMMKEGSYQPNPVRRQYIPKPNGKKRPLGIPSADDKLVQEVVRLMLESIFEPTFSKYSHGFRTNRSCHTALEQIKRTYTGVKWFVEGDIKGCFDNIDQHILVNILRRRIQDEQFIALIWKFLRAGYVEDWKYNVTYSGAAQGSIMSPILANIYMNELDTFMQKYKTEFDKGLKRRNNPEYSRYKAHWYESKKAVEKKWNRLTIVEKDNAKAKIEGKRQQWASLPSMDAMDPDYRRILYCRYADDFLIGIIGDKADAMRVRDDIRTFLSSSLQLDLSMEKTLITHSADKAQFLGYEITTSQPNGEFRKVNGARFRRSAGVIKLYVPKEKWVNHLLKREMMIIRKDQNDKETWKPVARSNFVNRDPVEIVVAYNAEIRGLYNYYSLASNVSVLNKYYYMAQYSMYHTFAAKYRCTATQAKQKFTKDGIFSIPYTSPKGVEKRIEFYHDGFAMKEPRYQPTIDETPKAIGWHNPPKELIARILAGKCEWCGTNDASPMVKQVKNLAMLNPESEWQAIMLQKHRITLILCPDCYAKT